MSATVLATRIWRFYLEQLDVEDGCFSWGSICFVSYQMIVRLGRRAQRRRQQALAKLAAAKNAESEL